MYSCMHDTWHKDIVHMLVVRAASLVGGSVV